MTIVANLLFMLAASGDTTDWVRRLEELFTGPNGTPRSDGCKDLTQKCNAGPAWDCKGFFYRNDSITGERLGEAGVAWYWVFRGVEGARNRLKAFQDRFDQESFYNFMELKKMGKEISAIPESTFEEKFSQWFGAATAVAGLVGGTAVRFQSTSPMPSLAMTAPVGHQTFIRALRANEGFLQGQLASIADTMKSIFEAAKPADDVGDPDDIGGELGVIMKKYVKGSLTAVENVVKAVMGDEGLQDSLNQPPTPALVKALFPDKAAHPIGKFLKEQPWLKLLDKDEARLVDLPRRTAENLRTRMAHEAVKASGYVLEVNALAGSAKDCGSKAGRQYLELNGKHYCTSLRKTGSRKEASEKFFNEILPKYGLGLRDAWYKNDLDCALRGGPKADHKKDELIGGWPVCFFEGPVAISYKSGLEYDHDEAVELIKTIIVD